MPVEQQQFFVPYSQQPVITTDSIKSSFSGFWDFGTSEQNIKWLKIGGIFLAVTVLGLLVYWAVVEIGRRKNAPQNAPANPPPFSNVGGNSSSSENKMPVKDGEITKRAEYLNSFFNESRFTHCPAMTWLNGDCRCVVFCVICSSLDVQSDAYLTSLAMEYSLLDSKTLLSKQFGSASCDTKCDAIAKKIASRLKKLGY